MTPPTALVEKPTNGVSPTGGVTLEQIELIKRTVAAGASDAELKLYLHDCQRQGVHPLDRLLHFTKRGGKYTPVTSIDLMRIRAAETNEYAGSDDAVCVADAEGRLAEASVTVYRLVQGQRCAFTATARWSEYYPGDQAGSMWRKMPHTMLSKCSEALALRKGFPRQLAGLYAAEEMEQASASAGAATPGGGGTGVAPSRDDSARSLVAPAGFLEWLDDFSATADEGFAKLEAAWKASKAEYRNHLTATNKGRIESLKLKAKAKDRER